MFETLFEKRSSEMKSIIIIGAGMGGLSAGVYGQMNGYNTSIFEMHTTPGGQCASWQRQGYTFDASIHHMMGCRDGTKVNQLFKELGVVPREMVSQKEVVAVADSKGNMFYDYINLEELQEHMLAIAPEDKEEIEKYVKGIQSFVGKDLMGKMTIGGKLGMLSLLPTIIRNLKYMKMTLKEYAKQFKNPLLRRAIPLMEYSSPEIPVGVHFAKHAAGTWGDILWPVGGGRLFAKSIADQYEKLGGTLNLGKKVEEIITKNNKAVGIRLEDGSEFFADVIISNADGRKTIHNMLGGRYMNDELQDWTKITEEETNWGTMVYLGVDRDLSKEPSALILLLDQPVTLTGKSIDSLELQIYGFDPTMAPTGKGVIKIEMVTPFSYWNCDTGEEYRRKKEQTAKQAISILEGYFPGITKQVEVTDVVTIKTWERFMGGTRGFANAPNKPFGFGTLMGSAKNTLPGLDNFYMTGVWASSTGAVFVNALTGKTAIKAVCKHDGRKFEVK